MRIKTKTKVLIAFCFLSLLSLGAEAKECCGITGPAKDSGNAGESGSGDRQGQLRINELMQSNIDCVMDDLNEFPDSWVELYNSGTTPVDLADYKLGLTANADSAWQLPPQAIVEPGAFVLVCCDKTGNGLHTDFRLNSDKGGGVYLFLNREVDDRVTELNKQPAPNIAYGRKTERGDEWGYQYVPTPGAANCGRLCKDILGDPVFSVPGKVLTDGTRLLLQLSRPSGSPDGCVIRFTTDGSEPTDSSTAYTRPITISSTTTVRAKLYCDGWLSPRSSTQSYIFLGREMTLPVISLVTDQRYWDDDSIGILTNNGPNNRHDWRRPVNLEYFETANRGSDLNQLCEMRVAGNTSRQFKLKSLVVYANKRFGTKRLDYEFFPDQRPGSTDFKSLMLRNAGSDYYYLYMRDAIIQRSMAAHADLDWQAWRPAIVFKNGVYKGILNIRERSNEDNVFTHYDHLEDIDMIENWWELKEGDLKNFLSFRTFYREEGHTLEEYEQWMDCTEFCNAMLTHLYFNNLDFPGSNWVLWRPRSEGGRWRSIVKDADLGLGGLSLPPDYPTLNWLYSPDYDPANSWGQNRDEATVLFRHLMDDAAFRKLFIDRAAVYMGDFLNERGTRAIWDAMYELIKPEYAYHRAAVDDGRFPDYNDVLDRLRSWLSQRTDGFCQHLADFYGLGTPTPVTINSGMGSSLPSDITVTVNGIALSKPVFDGKLFAGQDVTIDAESSGDRCVTGWKVELVDSAGTSSTTEVEGAHYSFTMPSCESLSIEAIMGMSAIRTAVVAERTDRSWHTLDGRRQAQRPQHSGLFLYGDRKVVVKH